MNNKRVWGFIVINDSAGIQFYKKDSVIFQLTTIFENLLLIFDSTINDKFSIKV